MASHAGLIYVLRTKKGYVGRNKTYANNIDEAEAIVFERFGFRDLEVVLEMLGFSEEAVWAETIMPSYESRLSIIENLYTDLGYELEDAMDKAASDFQRKDLYKDNNYKQWVSKLKNNVNEFNEKTSIIETINADDGVLNLKRGIKEDYIKKDEYEQQKFYSKKGFGYITTIQLKNIPIEKYFDCTSEERKKLQAYQLDEDKIKEIVINRINDNSFKLGKSFELLKVDINDDKLSCYTIGNNYELKEILLTAIRDYYEINEVHITRMFGSYILLANVDGNLKAVKATPIPIKYCPLMTKLLKEVGGKIADKLLQTLDVDNEQLQTEMMCNLINEVVIKGGYFNTSRPLNSCEANVLFGASETIASAFNDKLVDAAVIVSNNLGTIITTKASNTQGAVKRMTGLFYTSPSAKIMNTAKEAGIIPVFPYTATIDQIAGVKKAIALGYKNIAVTLAADNNQFHNQLKELELANNVTIYKFGLCSTGIDNQAAMSMRDHADVVWSCASKQVKEYIEPVAIAQVGMKIPVHVMTANGWKLIKNHLLHMNNNIDLENIKLISGDEKSIFLNDASEIKVLRKKEIHKCFDCPHPCV